MVAPVGSAGDLVAGSCISEFGRIVALNFFLLQAGGPQGNAYMQLLPLLLLFAVFYLLIFMPMQRQKKNQKQMLASLENGNIVLTSGGIVGTIVAIESDDTLVIRVKPDNVKIQVARSAVSSVVSGEGKK
jgi:preprotein translocase subunit YajC